ncbi:MAG: S1C family serine protease [Phycisphaerae bacterium]
MINRNTIGILVAAAVLVGIAPVGGENAAWAAAADASTNVAAAPVKKSAATAPQGPRWLGVAMEKIPPIFSRLLGLSSQQGLLVIQVVPNSPAFKAHLQPGDLLVALNGKALENPFALIRAENCKGAVPPTLNITLIRDGLRKSVTLTPVARPQHLIFFVPRRLAPAGALPAGAGPPNGIQTTGLMTVGPGVPLRMATAAVPQGNQAQPDLFTIRQWIGRQGTRHLEILWRSMAYEIQPGRLNRLPPPVQAVARLILRGQAEAPAPSRYMRLQQRLVAVKTLIQKLHAQEKTLEQQAAACAPSTPPKP